MPQQRPIGYAIIDDAGSNQPDSPEYPRELPEASGGFGSQVLPSTKHNHTGRRVGHWNRWVDQQMPRHDLFFGTLSTRLTLDSLQYSFGTGLSQPLLTDSAYVIGGVVVDLSIAEVASWALDTYTFAATKDTHVYGRVPTLLTPPLRFQTVAIGTPAAPGAGEIHLGTMTTDASDCTAWTPTTDEASLTQRVRIYRQWDFEAQTVMRGPVQWISPVGTTRVHKRQNRSANSKGFTYDDCHTFEALTGADNVCRLLTAANIPAGSRVAIAVRVAAVNANNPDTTTGGCAFFTSMFLRTTFGAVTTIGGTSPDKSFLGSTLTSIFLDTNDGNGIDLIVTVPGGVSANLECSFSAAVSLA